MRTISTKHFFLCRICASHLRFIYLLLNWQIIFIQYICKYTVSEYFLKENLNTFRTGTENETAFNSCTSREEKKTDIQTIQIDKKT